MRFGWIPDLPDARDFTYSALRTRVTHLPAKVDLRPQLPPVLDQGDLGSCTAHAIANAHLFAQMKEGHKPVMPSRLFIYYNERRIEHTTRSDSGAQIRDGFKTLAHDGVCPESEWPYDPARFAKRPLKPCYTSGKQNIAIEYRRLSGFFTTSQIRGCLAEGFPFVFGFTVYESFESDKVAASGVANLPEPGEKVVGGHAVLAVGYNMTTGRLLVMNSWGTGWGDKGFFTLPFAYVTNDNLAADLWTLRTVK